MSTTPDLPDGTKWPHVEYHYPRASYALYTTNPVVAKLVQPFLEAQDMLNMQIRYGSIISRSDVPEILPLPTALKVIENLSPKVRMLLVKAGFVLSREIGERDEELLFELQKEYVKLKFRAKLMRMVARKKLSPGVLSKMVRLG